MFAKKAGFTLINVVKLLHGCAGKIGQELIRNLNNAARLGDAV